MHQHPTLIEALARERVAEHQRSAKVSAVRRSDAPRRNGESVRNRFGWLLVDIGLRLALPRCSMNRPVQRRQRALWL